MRYYISVEYVGCSYRWSCFFLSFKRVFLSSNDAQRGKDINLYEYVRMYNYVRSQANETIAVQHIFYNARSCCFGSDSYNAIAGIITMIITTALAFPIVPLSSLIVFTFPSGWFVNSRIPGFSRNRSGLPNHFRQLFL